VSEPRAGDGQPLSLVLRIDAACLRFEAAWQAGQRPRLEDYLAEVPAAERPAWLAELLPVELAYRRRSGERPTLEEYRQRFPAQADEVQAAFGDTLLSAPPPLQKDAERSTSNVPPSPPVPGPTRPGELKQIDEYRLLEKIGEGGMGAVFKAVHLRLEKVVAVKLLLAGRADDPQAVARFRREMRAVGRLNHPHIVRATDAGEADGYHFLAMDFVEGIDLARLVKARGPLPVAAACELVRQAALGLQHAHEHGLVHRDIKPSNLMLGRDGRVQVLDLGLARLHANRQAGDELTTPDQIMGTLDYMAPEQAGGAHGVDIRADIYSLGCTLYQLLTGRPPFAGPQFVHPAQKLAAHLHFPPPPLQGQRPHVPAALAAVVARMLAKQPADRFATPAEVANALAPFAGGYDLTGLLTTTGLAPPTRLPEEPPLSTGGFSGPAGEATQTALPRGDRSRHLWRWAAGLAAGLGILSVGWFAWQTGTPRPDETGSKPAPPAAAKTAPPDRDAARPFLNEATILSAVRTHLLGRPAADRPYQRYFTLTSIHNRLPAADLQRHRGALVEAIGELAGLTPVDAAQVVYNLDVRRLGWDRDEVWEELLKLYPYGLKYDRHPDPALRDLARAVYELSGSDLPYLRADWFLVAAGRPPLAEKLRIRHGEEKKAADAQTPVGLATAFYIKNLGAADAAAELGLEGPDKLCERIRGSEPLRQLGLGPLAAGGTVTRAFWEALDPPLYSVFQHAAWELDQGTPYRHR
jgi:serine/threonine protein kinase